MSCYNIWLTFCKERIFYLDGTELLKTDEAFESHIEVENIFYLSTAHGYIFLHQRKVIFLLLKYRLIFTLLSFFEGKIQGVEHYGPAVQIGGSQPVGCRPLPGSKTWDIRQKGKK